MIFRLILLTVLIFPTLSWSQQGFLGKMNRIELSVLSNVPLLSGGFSEDNYFKTGSKMRAHKDWLDFGGVLNYKRLLAKRSALEFSFSLKATDILVDTGYSSRFIDNFFRSYERTAGLQSEALRFNTFSFIPSYCIASNSSLNGAGFSHTIGLGISLTKISNKYYYYSIQENPTSGNYDWTTPDYFVFSENNTRYASLTFKYGFHLTYPISERFLVKAGSTFLVNLFAPAKSIYSEKPPVDFIDYESTYYSLRREAFINWNLETGICWTF